MAPPLGTWNVVTMNNGLLNITGVDPQGNVTGTIQFDPSDTYNISGTWDASKKSLTSLTGSPFCWEEDCASPSSSAS